MDPISIISILGTVAPSLIKWATGSDSAEKVATVAVNAARALTGIADPNTQVEAFRADPALALQFKQQMLDQDKAFEQMYVDDKKDARARDTALSSTPMGNVRANYLVGYAVFVITAILLIVIFKPPVDEYVKSTIILILGMFINELKNIYNFEFGTTRRSREKTDILENLKEDK